MLHCVDFQLAPFLVDTTDLQAMHRHIQARVYNMYPINRNNTSMRIENVMQYAILQLPSLPPRIYTSLTNTFSALCFM